MDEARTRINAGAVAFVVEYEKGVMHDQGVRIRVIDANSESGADILSFDCFDQEPAYQYTGLAQVERHRIDRTTSSSPLNWAMHQLREHLPAMLAHAGRADLAADADQTMLMARLDETEAAARVMALSQRRFTVHQRGDVVYDLGNLKIGLEARVGGLTVHVLSEVAGQEIELLAFDCFPSDRNPHFHYGPRNQDVRIYWDTTLVPDTLRWTFDQFAAGRLSAMVERAGYPTIASGLDEALLAERLREIEADAFARRQAHAHSS